MKKHTVLRGTAGLLLLLALVVGVWLPARAAVSTYVCCPYFFITSVNRDTDVTIAAYNFPPNDTFTVRMNYYGTYGLGGYVVGTVTTDATGALSNSTFSIPAGLAGQVRIAIRLESPTTGYYAYNWFWNNTTGSSTPSPSPTPSYVGYPYFYISAVKRGDKVTIKPHHFPPNDTFTVRMNFYGTYGIGGYDAGTVTTDANGNLSSIEFTIPPQLAGLDRIAIRLESPTSGYYAYNWFWNYDATVTVP